MIGKMIQIVQVPSVAISRHLINHAKIRSIKPSVETAKKLSHGDVDFLFIVYNLIRAKLSCFGSGIILKVIISLSS